MTIRVSAPCNAANITLHPAPADQLANGRDDSSAASADLGRHIWRHSDGTLLTPARGPRHELLASVTGDSMRAGRTASLACAAQVTDVSWLATSTTMPAHTPHERLGKLAPLLVDETASRLLRAKVGAANDRLFALRG